MDLRLMAYVGLRNYRGGWLHITILYCKIWEYIQSKASLLDVYDSRRHFKGGSKS